MISNEQIAHDLAIAYAQVQASKKSNLHPDISMIRDYKYAYDNLLDLVKRTR